MNMQKQFYLIESFTKFVDDSTELYTQLVNQRDYAIIKCVYSLKSLGFNFTIKQFEETDKLNLLKKLWMSHAKNTKCLEIMCYICLSFNIFNSKIWNGILKQMVSFSMVWQNL